MEHHIENQLQKKGISPTAMRLLIFKFLEEQSVTISLTDLENTFKKSERTTLYRTLKTFEEKGVVHKIDVGTRMTKYALCETGCNCEMEIDLHLHFRCTHCNKTQCLTEQRIPHINLPVG